MNENTGQFRSAAFGGFHRQDVLDYLERITRENQTQKQALEQALAEEQAARAQAEARAQQAENKAAEAVADREAFEQTLAESRQAQEKITAALAEAEAQVAALREKVNDLEPGAESWRRIKDTAGDIEVSAHERAQRIIQSAQDRRRNSGGGGPVDFGTASPLPAPQRGSAYLPLFGRDGVGFRPGRVFPGPGRCGGNARGFGGFGGLCTEGTFEVIKVTRTERISALAIFISSDRREKAFARNGANASRLFSRILFLGGVLLQDLSVDFIHPAQFFHAFRQKRRVLSPGNRAVNQRLQLVRGQAV